MKRNWLYTEMLKVGLSWSVNTSINPYGKDCKTKAEQPGQLFCDDLSWTSHTSAVQLAHWLFLFLKEDQSNEHSAQLGSSKGQRQYYQLLFCSDARPRGLLSQRCASTWQISSSMLFAVTLSKTMRIGASWPSLAPSRNIFFFFSIAWLNRPPFRWRWNLRAADTGTPAEELAGWFCFHSIYYCPWGLQKNKMYFPKSCMSLSSNPEKDITRYCTSVKTDGDKHILGTWNKVALWFAFLLRLIPPSSCLCRSHAADVLRDWKYILLEKRLPEWNEKLSPFSFSLLPSTFFLLLRLVFLKPTLR